jgi:exonuclease SbcC
MVVSKHPCLLAMIPKQLRLQNFLSYREATLDFQGLHVACICGANGAGKSSLLEAMVWALWGQSRVANEDDVIHLAAEEARVQFVFEHCHQTYRILRARRRKQGGFLEFQLQTPVGFRSLTQGGLRATQQQIARHLKIDYETFVHSAYLRQGHADEFMLKRPSERKQILADLLKLDHYDRLADKAKAKARDCRIQASLLESGLAQLAAGLAQRSAIASAYAQLQTQLSTLNQTRQTHTQRLDELQAQQQQRQNWSQERQLAQQQLAHHQHQDQHLRQVYQQLQRQLQQWEAILAQAEEVETGYQQLQQLQIAEEQLALKFQTYQDLKEQQAQLHEQTVSILGEWQAEERQWQAQLDQVQAQIQDLQQTLAQRPEVNRALAQLQEARAQLQTLDKLQIQITPLRQRHQCLQADLQREEMRLTVQLTEIINTQSQLETQKTQQPQLLQSVMDVSHRLTYLKQRRTYQEQVRQKGQERRSFMERLQADQRHYEVQLAQLDQKIQLLSDPQASCPLCERPLLAHGPRVFEQLQLQRQETQDQIWVIREQLAVSEREIQVLRREYREIEAELAQYATVLEQRGNLQAQLASVQQAIAQLAQLDEERLQLERCLQNSQYATHLHEEVQALSETLAKTGYDERDHALRRNQVEKLRWAEIKQAELKQASRRLEQLQAQQPVLMAKLQTVQAKRSEFDTHHPIAQALLRVTQQFQALAYDLEAHQQLRAQLREAQPWQARFQELQQARQQHPVCSQQLAALEVQQASNQQAMDAIATRLQVIETQLNTHADVEDKLAALSAQLAAQQALREEYLAQLGRLEQQISQLDHRQTQYEQQQRALQSLQRKQQIYQALAQAFGKNGIQALMIENLLPQLEATTNQILGRLSAHQLHVQFVTQRAGRQRHKLIDTLDILIADVQGTRAYETYSGGEAFRVNFAIRLALARLLAQQSGMALQMLIVDEGFGTQDQAGCNRLIAAINAISPEFACILAVTHMPHFREAFQTRIDVTKTDSGSQIRVEC